MTRLSLSEEEIDLLLQALREHEDRIFQWFQNDHENHHVECIATDKAMLRKIEKLKLKIERAPQK